MKKYIPFLIEMSSHMHTLIRNFTYSIIDTICKTQGWQPPFASESLIASYFNRGFLVSSLKLPRKISYSNMILVSPSGGGKTTKILIPLVLNLKRCSMILNDPDFQFSAFAGYLQKHFTIQPINFSDASKSSGFNFLAMVENVNDINKIAHQLISSSYDKSGNTDNYWILQSKNFLVLMLRLTMHQSEEYRTIPNCLRLITIFSANPNKIDSLMAKTNDAELILQYKSMISLPEKTLSNVVSSTKAALLPFEDPQIAKVCSFHTLDVKTLRDKPTLWVLQNSIADLEYLGPIIGLFFNCLYNYFLRQPINKKELPLYFVIEEASTFKIDNLSSAILNTRKHKIGNLLCVQGYDTLETLYGRKSRTLIDNCATKVFLPGISNLQTLKEIEALSGRYTVKEKNGVERSKPMITIDQIRQLPENRSIIFNTNQPVIMGRTRPYFKSFRYRYYESMPMSPIKGDLPETAIPYLPI